MADLNAETWIKWIPAIVRYPFLYDADREQQNELVKLAYAKAPDEFVDTFRAVIRADDAQHERIHVLDRVDHIVDEVLGQVLLEEATNTSLSRTSVIQLVGAAFDHDVEGAREAAVLIVNGRGSPAEGSQDQAIGAAAAMMLHATDCGWEDVWPTVSSDTLFGTAVVAQVAQGEEWRRRSLPDRLTEVQLADLYIWLEQQFPVAEDADDGQARMMGVRDSLGFFRSGVFEALCGRGTVSAATAIERVAEAFPDGDWYRPLIEAARRDALAKSWVPPSPSQILELFKNGRARLIRGGAELQETLIEALDRLQALLQGETPAAPDLWDKIGNVYRPKDENALSDYVKRFLEQELVDRGVIVNREVEIRRGEGQGQGEETDIHVNAVIKEAPMGEAQKVTAIVETKGCWHTEMFTAMRTQLVDRYMNDNQCRHGIYLVGCFHCPQWDPGDYRINRNSHTSGDEIVPRLRDQAVDLSDERQSVTAYVLNVGLR